MNAILPARRKVNVHEYHRMGEAGILHEDDRVELIEGDLIQMAPIGSGHASAVDRLTQALFMACAGKAIVRVQSPVRLDDRSEPQPDFAILRRRADHYEFAHPGPDDILLLIEVADSSLGYDTSVKLPLYARSRIGEVWILDRQQRRLDVFREPADATYRTTTPYGAGQTVGLALAPDVQVTLAF